MKNRKQKRTTTPNKKTENTMIMININKNEKPEATQISNRQQKHKAKEQHKQK